MKVSKQPEDLGFNCAIVFTSLERRVQQLAPQGIKANLLAKPPSKLPSAYVDTFSFQICCQRSEPSAKLAHSLSWAARKVHVKGLPELTTLVKGSVPVHVFPSLHQFVDTH
jgi:hypothetical protein